MTRILSLWSRRPCAILITVQGPEKYFSCNGQFTLLRLLIRPFSVTSYNLPATREPKILLISVLTVGFEHKKVLLIGGTSGIGLALGTKFLENGIAVIAVGRRQDRLDDIASKIGKDNMAEIDTYAFDITKLDAIPSFASDIYSRHPDIDCVFINSGMQRNIDWTKPDSIDLNLIQQELTTNYIAWLHLMKAFLPYLQQQAPKPTGLLLTSSGLALIPHPACSNYAASKAALHHLTLSMREQLRDANSNVKVVEIFPPMVQTELHDAEHGGKGQTMGMPLADFVEETWEKLNGNDNEQIFVQNVNRWKGDWEMERQKTYLTARKQMLEQ